MILSEMIAVILALFLFSTVVGMSVFVEQYLFALVWNCSGEIEELLYKDVEMIDQYPKKNLGTFFVRLSRRGKQNCLFALAWTTAPVKYRRAPLQICCHDWLISQDIFTKTFCQFTLQKLIQKRTLNYWFSTATQVLNCPNLMSLKYLRRRTSRDMVLKRKFLIRP